ncbi:MAG: hypothetical protein AB8B77_08155 [Alphaproteobacteria bacterium]
MRRILKIVGIALAVISVIGVAIFGVNHYLTTQQKIADFVPYHKLDRFTFPVIRGDAVAKYVMVDIAVNFNNPDSKTKFDAARPRVIDSYLIELMDYFALSPLDSPVDAALLKDRLQRVSNGLIGADVVDQIMLEGVFERNQRSG